MRNEQVVQAWIDGQKASTGRLSTDGKSLYSYDLKIGERFCVNNSHPVPHRCADEGFYVVWNYRRRGGGVYNSQTTSTHVGLACDALMHDRWHHLVLHPSERSALMSQYQIFHNDFVNSQSMAVLEEWVVRLVEGSQIDVT